MRGPKCSAWEGGTRAFSFWRWPGKWKPRLLNNLTAHLDVFPTLCELTGTKIPANLKPKLEGHNLLPLLESKGQVKNWQKDRILFHHVARWPSGFAKHHKYAMAGVRQGNFLMLRSHHCGNKDCLKYMSQCMALQAIEKGRKVHTYAYGTAQYHWAISPKDKWVLFDVKKDPQCENDLADQRPGLVARLDKAYDQWWDDTYPEMIAMGGDAGNPDEGRQAAKKSSSWKGKTSDKK
jgi:arylsulfatase A-like enzyme